MKRKQLQYVIRLTIAALLLFDSTAMFGQSPAPTASPAATPLPDNAMVSCAGGVQLVFVPGPDPTLTAIATDGDTPVGLLRATVQTVRFVDKHGRAVDPASITQTERLIPIGGSGPQGLILQQILVDRN